MTSQFLHLAFPAAPPQQYFRRLLCVFLISLVSLVGCQSRTPDDLIEVRNRDFQEQVKIGNGEGLAKPVPNRPILVNNALAFSVPGNAVLGIAMSVGTIKSTTEALSSISEIDLVEIVRNELEGAQVSEPTVVEPYCYLFGHPKATLEARLFVKSEGRSDTLSKKLSTKAIDGEESWSMDNGKQLIEDCSDGIKTLTQKFIHGRTKSQ